MLDVVVVYALPHTEMDAVEDYHAEDDQGVSEGVLEFLFGVFTRPEERRVQFIQDFDSLRIQFVKDRLVQRIRLKGGHFEIFIGQQLPFDDRFPLFLTRPHIYHVVLVVACFGSEHFLPYFLHRNLFFII